MYICFKCAHHQATAKNSKNKSLPTITVGNGHYSLAVVDPSRKIITYYDGLKATKEYDPEYVDEDVEKITAKIFTYVKVSRCI
jgi:hypothetical protein